MSRIGKKPIILPAGVNVAIDDGVVKVKGPKGELEVKMPPKVRISQEDGLLVFTIPTPDDSRQESFWGLARTLVANAVVGVTEGFSKKLELNGVGYRVAMKGDDLGLALGFSHPVDFKAPAGISFAVEGNIMTVSGINKHLVGETAAQLRRLRPVEPYKGKGIKYVGEFVRRKAGKVAKSGA
ncbi:MAG: 50S ribosomal protein L6 [Candidatus Komeilibacteria bacterium]|nr:50S ribosomal protein L6 [Candidatus Komeilibacteria bacterium]